MTTLPLGIATLPARCSALVYFGLCPAPGLPLEENGPRLVTGSAPQDPTLSSHFYRFFNPVFPSPWPANLVSTFVFSETKR
jgi:hypothetical protein